MKSPIARISFTTTTFCICIMLVTLVGYDIYPLLNGNDYYVIEQQTWTQVARCEFMAKDVLVLVYRPASFHSQAINELQTTLPQFQQVQIGLTTGSTILNLPIPSNDIAIELDVAKPEYVALTTAIAKILSTPDTTPDPIEVNIVMQHELQYAVDMANVAVLIQQEAEQTDLHIIVIKVIIKILILLIIAIGYFFIEKNIFRAVLQNQQGGDKAEISQSNEHSLHEKGEHDANHTSD